VTDKLEEAYMRELASLEIEYARLSEQLVGIQARMNIIYHLLDTPCCNGGVSHNAPDPSTGQDHDQDQTQTTGLRAEGRPSP